MKHTKKSSQTKTVYLSNRIHKRVALQAVKESRTIQEVVGRLIEQGFKYEQELKAKIVG